MNIIFYSASSFVMSNEYIFENIFKKLRNTFFQLNIGTQSFSQKGFMASFRYLLVQGSTLTFEGTCQVGQVNFNFYLPCKRCDSMNMKVNFLYICTILVPINYFPDIALSVLLTPPTPHKKYKACGHISVMSIGR